jgi:hypothetical protein
MASLSAPSSTVQANGVYFVVDDINAPNSQVMISFDNFMTNAQRRAMFEQFRASKNVPMETTVSAYIVVNGQATKVLYRNGNVVEESESNNILSQLLNTNDLKDVPRFSAETEQKLLELRKDIGKLTKKLIKLRNNKNRAAYLAKKEERQALVNRLVSIINEADPNNGFFSATKSAYENSNSILEAKRQLFATSLRTVVQQMYGDSLTLTSAQEDKILNLYMLNLILSGALHNLNKARPVLIENYLKYHLIELGKQQGVKPKEPEPISELELEKQKTAKLEAQLQALMKKSTIKPSAAAAAASPVKKPAKKNKLAKKNKPSKKANDSDNDSDSDSDA